LDLSVKPSKRILSSASEELLRGYAKDTQYYVSTSGHAHRVNFRVRSTNKTKEASKEEASKKNAHPSSVINSGDADRSTTERSTKTTASVERLFTPTFAIAAANDPSIGKFHKESSRSAPTMEAFALRSVGTHLINSRKKISLFE
jgi:hypothetical protein